MRFRTIHKGVFTPETIANASFSGNIRHPKSTHDANKQERVSMSNILPCLNIGGLKISPPIIQGGMGVMVSGPRLVSAVSNTGALGVLASVGNGEADDYKNLDFEERSARGFRDIIRETKAATKNPIAINIMCALTNYASLVEVAVEEHVEVIISGAGLPLKLPSFVAGHPEIKLVPIVSSARAAGLICKVWNAKYSRLPDALIVEGPLADTSALP